jgi:PhnB protein
MQSNTYLNFNGECKAAFKFYEQCLGGKISGMMTYGESPMAEQTPTEQIMHVQRTIARSLNTLLLQLNQST